jgi:phenylalanyl-tRNA synthetase beta chain
VIADDAAVHDIGGIMGGEHSGVSETTTDVLIECAYFTPEHIARTGQKLALTSDARQRFERGVDPAFLDEGLAIATWLVTEHCGGTPSAVTRAGHPPVERKVLRYDPGLCLRLGGLDVPADEQRAILARLGFNVCSCESRSPGEPGTGLLLSQEHFEVTVPTWRRDVDGPADLVEEVVRIAGIDKVPSTPLPRADGVARPTATAEQLVERRVRRTAAARGLNEAVTWSFISETEAAALGGGAWTLDNPISEDMKVMRPSLLAGLLAAAQRNMDRGAKSVRLFELGRRYLADGERPTVGFVLAGDRTPRDWQAGKAQPFGAFDAKAEALALLDAAGAPVDNLQVMGDASAAYHPGQSATLRLGPKAVLAEFGALHPSLVKSFGLDGSVIAGEIFLDAIPARRASGRIRPAYTPPALQPVTRDYAFLVPETLAAGDLVRAIRGADKALITSARLFDVFTGAGVPDGQKSLAIEVTLQPTDRTLTDEDLAGVSSKIVAAAAKLGAALRG